MSTAIAFKALGLCIPSATFSNQTVVGPSVTRRCYQVAGNTTGSPAGRVTACYIDGLTLTELYQIWWMGRVTISGSIGTYPSYPGFASPPNSDSGLEPRTRVCGGWGGVTVAPNWESSGTTGHPFGVVAPNLGPPSNALGVPGDSVLFRRTYAFYITPSVYWTYEDSGTFYGIGFTISCGSGGGSGTRNIRWDKNPTNWYFVFANNTDIFATPFASDFRGGTYKSSSVITTPWGDIDADWSANFSGGLGPTLTLTDNSWTI